MTVVQLRAHLEQRQLPKSGLKKALQQRLRAHAVAQAPAAATVSTQRSDERGRDDGATAKRPRTSDETVTSTTTTTTVAQEERRVGVTGSESSTAPGHGENARARVMPQETTAAVTKRQRRAETRMDGGDVGAGGQRADAVRSVGGDDDDDDAAEKTEKVEEKVVERGGDAAMRLRTVREAGGSRERDDNGGEHGRDQLVATIGGDGDGGEDGERVRHAAERHSRASDVVATASLRAVATPLSSSSSLSSPPPPPSSSSLLSSSSLSMSSALPAASITTTTTPTPPTTKKNVPVTTDSPATHVAKSPMAMDAKAHRDRGPFTVLERAVADGTPCLINCRNDSKLYATVKAYDRHFNMVLVNVHELRHEGSGGGGGGGLATAAAVRERYIPKMFVRGDSVVFVLRMPL